MKLKTILAAAMSTTFLAACGGGSGDAPATTNPSNPSNTSASATTKAEGVYEGNFSTSAFPNGVVQTIILENDQIWALYGTPNAATGGNTIYGMIQGDGTSNNGSFSSSNIKDFAYKGTTATGTLSASYQHGVSLNGSISSGGQSASFAASAPSNSTYNYNTAATLSDIVGPWTGSSLNGSISSFTIGNTGSFAVNDAGCVISGAITPRGTNKNVFNLSVTAATSSACGSSSGVRASGIAVSALLGSGKRQLIALLVDSTRTVGTAFFATR